MKFTNADHKRLHEYMDRGFKNLTIAELKYVTKYYYCEGMRLEAIKLLNEKLEKGE